LPIVLASADDAGSPSSVNTDADRALHCPYALRVLWTATASLARLHTWRRSG